MLTLCILTNINVNFYVLSERNNDNGHVKNSERIERITLKWGLSYQLGFSFSYLKELVAKLLLGGSWVYIEKILHSLITSEHMHVVAGRFFGKRNLKTRHIAFNSPKHRLMKWRDGKRENSTKNCE